MPLANTSTIIIGCEFRNSQQNTEHYSMIFIDSDVNNSDSDVLSIYDTKFINNKANKILYAVESDINIDNSTFIYTHGLAMDLCTCIVDIFNSVFNNNEAGALKLFNTIIHIHGSEFKENAKDGAIHSSSKSFISFSGVCTLVGNQAKQGGAIYLNQGAQCFVAYGVTVIIANNTASSPAGVSHVGIFRNRTVKWVVPYNGGGIYLDNHSKLTLHSHSTLQILENRATVDGGGIYLSDHSNVTLHSQSTLQILENRATVDGGGIYLGNRSNVTLHSQSTLQILENRATENGGGIYVVKLSSINLGFKSLTNISQTSNSTVYFYGNRARIGGGLYLGLDSQVYAFPCLNNTVIFDENSADYGGAMYATAAKSSLQYYNSDTKCFFQSETLPNPVQNYNICNDAIKCNKQDKTFYFSLNRANYSGSSLYKDAFNQCSINGTSFDEFELLGIMSNIQTSDIGSYLVHVCFCENGLPDCSKQIPYINIKTGEKLILDVAITDRGNHIVSGSIESEIRGSTTIRDDQKMQDVTNGCTASIFNIYSFEASQQLIMSPQLKSDSIYISTAASERNIKLNILACINCPIGFQQIKDDARGCDCVCDVMKLESYILKCNYIRETIIKKGTTAWIGYLNTSGYLIYPYCPMDYCFPSDETVEINLNIQNGADAQCAHNRSGTLCGSCSPGLSLSLGSSCCLQCHEYWPGIFVIIITSSLLAGFIQVTSLLILNLTVANGTLVE